MADQVQALTVDVSVAAGSVDERYITQAMPGTWEVEAIYFAPATAVALNGTNYMTSTITSNDGAAGADVAVGSHTTNTGGDALVLKTSVALSLTAGAGLELAQGAQLKFAKTEVGSGAALDGAYTVYLRKARV